MSEYMSKISKDGRIVIPAKCRSELHLAKGDPVILRIEDNELHIYSIKNVLKKAQSLIQQYSKGRSLVNELKKMRKEDNSYKSNFY